MRHRIVKNAALTAVAAVALLLWASPTLAGQKMTWKEVSRLSQVHKMQAPDAEDHLLGIYEHKGVALFPDGRAAAMLSMGRFDVYDREGGRRKHDGYAKISFADGSAIFFKCQGTETFKDGSKLPWVTGTGTFMKGIGRYKGIKGTLTYEGGYVTGLDKNDQGGDAVLTYQAEYTLEKQGAGKI
ncbi:MAG: hypothetical protein KQI62_13255 [Deltaproteobacteria bacterium]|nr:hypothetical protein [Deltaproteobacteria bacterium]